MKFFFIVFFKLILLPYSYNLPKILKFFFFFQLFLENVRALHSSFHMSDLIIMAESHACNKTLAKCTKQTSIVSFYFLRVFKKYDRYLSKICVPKICLSDPDYRKV